MTKAPGLPLELKWKTSEETISEADVLGEQKAKVVFQLGIVTEQLSRLSFNQAGSLFGDDGEYSIRTCLSSGLILNERYVLEAIPRGPFQCPIMKIFVSFLVVIAIL